MWRNQYLLGIWDIRYIYQRSNYFAATVGCEQNISGLNNLVSATATVHLVFPISDNFIFCGINANASIELQKRDSNKKCSCNALESETRSNQAIDIAKPEDKSLASLTHIFIDDIRCKFVARFSFCHLSFEFIYAVCVPGLL